MNLNLNCFDEKLGDDLLKLGFRKSEAIAFRSAISLALVKTNSSIKWTLYNGVTTLGFAVIEREFRDCGFNEFIKQMNHYVSLLKMIRDLLDNFRGNL